jgi:predicted DNA-binding ribbon-helix-helix protein
MATSISLKNELYNQVAERARAAKTTPEEWLDQIVAERLEREDLAEATRVFSKEMRRKMIARGVKPSDVEREIADYRRGR